MFCKWNERCDGSDIVSCQARVLVLDNRRRGRGFVCDNRDRCSEKFKAGWYCVQNSFCSFLMGGRPYIYGRVLFVSKLVDKHKTETNGF